MKKILLLSVALVVILTGCGKKKTAETDNQPVVEQQTENTEVKAPITYDEAVVKEYVNIIQEAEKNKTEAQELQYRLIYFNQDDIPDLVVAFNGYWVRLYVYGEGKAHLVAEDWPYGAFGNAGYEYIEKQGIINNYNSDFAGALMTMSTMFLTNDWKFDTYSLTQLGAEVPKDDPAYQEVNQAFETYGGYYHEEEKITEEEYEKKMEVIDRENVTTGWLSGEMTAAQMVEELQNHIK